MMKRVRWMLLFLFALQGIATATGMLIPKDPGIPPLAIRYQRVNIEIKNQVATTKVEQVFQNSVNRDLEATYIFPLPENASIQDFAMYINGKRMSGELVEKNKARKIYEDIVRRMRDPGILEYMGNNLFRIRVYPVPKSGTQKIELAYSEVLKMDGGVCKYVYPLKTSGTATRTLEDFSVAATLESKTPIRTVYSPSHKVGISKKSDHLAVIGFEQNRSILDRDFVLYYTVSEKDIGINLVTYRVGSEDGYFMLMISPSAEIDESQVLPKDVCFVVDTSGSMQENNKIEQAKNALKYCVQNLSPKDTFNIIRFSTDVDQMANNCLPATEANVQKAVAFIDTFRAAGGTCISEALAAALTAKGKQGRPYNIVFMTDGKPTVGVTDINEIVANVKRANPRNARVFVFGVGYGVNTHLLDQIADVSGGYPQYVKPDENIEMSVSSFSNKIRYPVLANPKLDLGKIHIRDMYPRRLPDLFKGAQLTLFGRYRDAGDVAIRLTGDVGGKKKEIVYEGTFPAKNTDNEFIKRLWATRKVGYLLDEIRLRGENPELKSAVIRLSKAYNIQTPYTSYLVLEDDAAYTRHGISRDRFKSRQLAPAQPGKDAAAAPSTPGLPALEPTKKAEEKMKASSGRMAFDMAQRVRKLKEGQIGAGEADDEREGVRIVKHVGTRTFVLVEGVWTDTNYKEGMETVTVKYGSAAYFKLLDAKPEWKDIFLLGDRVAFVVGNQCVVIDEKGAEELSADQFNELTR
ncbi:MAG: VWA domain-containing protein [Planctomycetes bacterium]|nr:VWA domain-containing protein [Planctomycetota bacterium]